MTAREKLGQLIMEKRLSKRITLRDFCKSNGIDAIYMSNIERGTQADLDNLQFTEILMHLDFNKEELKEIDYLIE